MPDTAELIEHLVHHYMPEVSVTHLGDKEDQLAASDVVEAYAGFVNEALSYTGDITTSNVVELLNADGEELFVGLGVITPEEIDAAVVYAAGEAAALKAALSEVTDKAIALLRMKIAQPTGQEG